MHDRPGRRAHPPDRLLPTTLTALVLVGLLAMTVPLTTAQSLPSEITVEAEVRDDPGALAPSDTQHEDLLDVRVRCEAPTIVLAPVVVDHRVEVSHDRVNAAPGTLHETIATDLQECAVRAAEANYELNVLYSLPSSIPAGEEITFRLWAAIDGEEHLAAEWTRQVAVSGTFIADAYPLSVWTRPGEQDTIEALIVNRANTPLVVQVEAMEGPRYGNLSHPESVLVPYDPTSNKNAVTFDIQYERSAPGTDTFRLRLVATSEGPFETTIGEQSIALRAEDDGTFDLESQDSPGPLPVLAPLFLVSLAFLVRRSSGRE